MGDVLTDRIALVTGASRGIGRATAIALASAGCRLAVVYHLRREDAEDAVRAVEEQGRSAVAIQADVSNPDDVARMAREVTDRLGPVDILVNNAGTARPLPIDELSLADFDEAIAVNLRSAFLVTQAFLPAMRARRWGRLVFLSSVAAQVGGVVGPHYAASKAGLHGLAHAYASLLAKEGITSNVIAPALIDTAMVRDNPRARPDLIPIGRFGQAGEVADLVLAVVSNAYLTGQTLNVNGGWYFS